MVRVATSAGNMDTVYLAVDEVVMITVIYRDSHATKLRIAWRVPYAVREVVVIPKSFHFAAFSVYCFCPWDFEDGTTSSSSNDSQFSA